MFAWSHIPKVIASMRLRGRRRGVSNIEYVLIASLVAAVLALSVSVVGHNTHAGMARLSDRISEVKQLDSPHDADAGLTPPAAVPPYDTTLLVCLTMLSVMSIAGLGIAVVQHVRRQNEKRRSKSRHEVALKKNLKAMEAVLNKYQQFKRLLRDDLPESLLEQCTVGNFMTANVFTVAPDMTLQAASDQLEENQFRRVLVKTKDGTLAGVLSKKDIALKDGEFVRDVMTGNPKTVTIDTKIHFALTILLKNRISCLPVVDENYRLLGMISTSDLIIMLHCLLSVLHDRQSSPSVVLVAENP